FTILVSDQRRCSGVSLDMDDQELINSLNSIGKGCFVTHYELFRDKVLSDNLFVIEGLVKIERYTESGARIRVGFARAIFKARREHDALKIISESKRLPRQLTAKAKILLGGNRVSAASPRSITPIDTPIRPDAQIILPSRISNPANAR